ncbi:MAG: hypothetical protein R3343_10470, partial [Nitriliruptorales bacterium]|nr:hypothetical protein [Nitriliruptorales bacterium]
MPSARSSVLVLLTAALLLALPTAAVAQHDTWEGHADGEGFLLQVPDVIEVGGGVSDADLSSAPTAHARGVGFLLSDGSISEVDIDVAGAVRRDPAEGENCGGPELPDTLDLADIACSMALGDTAGATGKAAAEATGTEVSVSGGDITALVDFLLGHIPAEDLDAAINDAEAAVLTPVIDALAETCLQTLNELGLGDAFADGGELIAAIEQEGDFPIEVDLAEGGACDLLVQYVLDPPVLAEGAGEVLNQLEGVLKAALDGVSLLDVTLAGSDSTTSEAEEKITAVANAIGTDVALPSLNLLGNVETVLLNIVGAFINEIEDDIVDVDFVTDPDIPDPEELDDFLLDAIPAELQRVLSSSDPLLRVTGGTADPTATYDRDAAEFSTSGSVAPLIITLNEDLAALLGISDQNPITIPEGGSQTVAAGTPLEST